MRWLSLWFVVACVGCSAETPARGSAECAGRDEVCPAGCDQVKEARLDPTAHCLKLEPIVCTRTRAGRTAMNGCCARDDGALFVTSAGGPGCPYRAPAYLGFRDCTDAERALFPPTGRGC